MYGFTEDTSVLGVCFERTVALVFYHFLGRFLSSSRLMKVNENTVVGASGDNPDFQFIERKWKRKVIEGAYLTIVMAICLNQFTLD